MLSIMVHPGKLRMILVAESGATMSGATMDVGGRFKYVQCGLMPSLAVPVRLHELDTDD